MTDLADSRQARSGSYLKDLLLLVLFFGSLYAVFLGGYPLANPDEGRYAEVAREMVKTGDWVLPRLNDTFYFEKPPLVYWLNALVIQHVGRSEWALRSVPAFFAVLGVICSYLGARGLAGRAAGWIAAFFTATSLLYFIIGHIQILDMPVSALITGTLVCFLLGVREPPGPRRRWWFMGLYACAALATLSKGLIGLAVPGAVMFFWLLIYNQWRRLLPMYLPSGAAVFLLIAAPWHILAAQRNADWAWFYFVHEHLLRFTSKIHGRYQPFWYFVPILIAGLMPWPLHLWAGVRKTWQGGWAGRKENADLGFLLVWAGFIFLFFSASQSKLAPYIVPMIPALTIAGACSLAGIIERREWRALRFYAWSFLLFSHLLAAAFLAIVLQPTLLRDEGVGLAARSSLILLASVLLLGGQLAFWLDRLGRHVSGLIAQALVWCTTLAVLVSAAEIIQPRTTHDLSDIFNARAKPEDQVYHYRTMAHDFLYYTERPVGLVDTLDELEVNMTLAALPSGHVVDVNPEARKSGRFIDFAEFERRCAGPGRVWVLTRNREAEALKADPSGRYHLIAANRRYYLFSNQP